MGSSGAAVRRARWVAVFTLLLLVCSSIPAFAADALSPAESSDATSYTAPSEEELERLPDAQDVQEGIEMAEAEEATRERALQTPEAITQRKESRYAFADLNATGAQELFLAVFAKQLETLNSDPARWLSDASIAQPLGESAATVSKDGDTMLLDATIPLRAADENGDLRRVDLGLEAKPDGALEPANPLVDLRIPGQVDEPLLIGKEGIALTPLGAAEDRSALLLGDKNVFYADALGPAADTDQIVSPTATGVEIFDLLRSAESPEELRFEIDLPAGAELRSDGNGGAKVVRGEEQIASIPFPHAIDAQGTVIPVDLSIEESTVALHVAHREADVAYPILVDPAILNDWYNYSWANGHNFHMLENGTWNAQGNTGWIQTGTSCIVACFWSSGRGLYIGMQSGNHSPSNYSQWLFSAPNPNSYLAGAWINPFRREDYNCGNYNQPHDYVGMWHNGAWNTALKINQAKIYGYTDPNGWGSTLIIGMHTGGGVNIPCRRDLAVGGTAIWEDDWQSPTIGSTGLPSQWFGDQAPVSFNVSSGDAGLGVHRVKVFNEGKGIVKEDTVNYCTGIAGSRCPTTRSTSFTSTGDSFGEGIRGAKIYVEDPTGKHTGKLFTTKVDNSVPEVALSGQLAEATGEEVSFTEGENPVAEGEDKLSLPVYNLKIEAKDGSLSDDKAKRSGVKDIEVFLDGEEMAVPWSPLASCSQTSCAMTKTYTLELSEIETAGTHKLEVKAKDFVGEIKTRSIEFQYFPATGMKDEYLMHYFPLPDGLGDEEEEEHPVRPEMAVNVMNGNLVYRERDIDVEGPAVDLEVERYYNSQLPTSENTEWGDGWTLAQTPDLEPLDTGGSPAPDEAELIEASGAIEEGVELPVEPGAETFDPTLQATLGMKASGGYELTDETGESATSVAFNEDGRTEVLLTEGYAKVDYVYEAGELAEIAIDDPASAGGGPAEEAEEPEEPTGPYTGVIYADSLGSSGSEAGQLKSPGDVAIDSAGNVWVADTGNDRIQKYNPKGEFLLQFGSPGSGNGQLDAPSGIAIGGAGNVWVADTGNDRIQKFNGQGEFLAKFGSSGSGFTQFDEPVGLAFPKTGLAVIFVADRGNDRVQVLSGGGTFYGYIGSHGSGPGQLIEPSQIVFGAPTEQFSNTFFVTDSGNDRVQRFALAGTYIDQFGSSGAGAGKLSRPEAIDIDAKGNVWIGDRANSRVQQFSEAGEYLNQFGSAGSGEGEFALAGPMGVAADNANGIWITDADNHRVQKWVAGHYVPDEEEAEPAPDDPKVEIETPGGLVSSVAGAEAGEHDYEHVGDLLSAHEGPDGETVYEYDEADRLNKVTLANGTWAAVKYEALGRVKEITVSIEGGQAKTTYFTYKDDSPRRTTVEPPDAPHVVYDIGDDGSVFKWWNTQQPPELDLSGTLYDNREEDGALWAGDYLLDAEALSEEGIDSIEVLVDGTALVDEMTCEQDFEVEGKECKKVINEWVTSTDLHAPGHLQVEVLATDHLGQTTSERFWVDIPEPPPPSASGTPIPPKFRDIAKFREEYGLEVVFPVANEIELNERIFDLIETWHEPNTPAGQIARASMERWGVPLRWEDVAEMEYREWYMAVNIPLIEDWAESHHADSFSGYYVDHRSGGTLHVGFTQNQTAALSELKQQTSLSAPERLTVYPTVPTASRVSLATIMEGVEAAWATDPALENLITSAGIDEVTNTVEVTGTNTVVIDSGLKAALGQSIPIRVVYEEVGEEFDGRNHITGRVHAGDRIIGSPDEKVVKSGCTAGFGAWDKIGTTPTGEPKIASFLLTAGHCARPGYRFFRTSVGGPVDTTMWKKFGHVARTGMPQGGQHYETDGSAIRLNTGGLMPYYIYMNGQFPKPVGPAGRAHHGETLCFSGVGTNEPKRCGELIGVRVRKPGNPGRQLFLIARFAGHPGDSGAPVWSPRLQRSIGLVSGGPNKPGLIKDWITPLLLPRGHDVNKVPGILNAPGMGSLHLAVPGP